MIRHLLCLAAICAVALPGEAGAAERSPAQQALLQMAIQACNSPKYASGARPVVNYSRMTFTCVEPGSSRR